MTLQRFRIIGLAVALVSAVTVCVALPATPGDDSRYALLAIGLFVLLPVVLMSTGRGNAEQDGEARLPGPLRDGPHGKRKESE